MLHGPSVSWFAFYQVKLYESSRLISDHSFSATEKSRWASAMADAIEECHVWT